jgi:hypothetical protein
MGLVILGVDVGQKRDPTAVAVVEEDWRQKVCHHLVRYLERLPLGTPYPAVAERVGAITDAVHERTSSRPIVFVDATGVGQPVVDLLEERASRCRIVPCYFTHGDRRTEDADGTVKLGKAFLVSRLQTLLQAGRIHLPDTSEARALAEELLDFEIRVSEDALDRYGAFKVGTHDDLVTALGLAVQVQPSRSVYPPAPPAGSHPGEQFARLR